MIQTYALSTSKRKVYQKIIFLSIIACLILVVIFWNYNALAAVMLLTSSYFFIVHYFKIIRNLKSIKYDWENIYFEFNEYDIQIPFTEIKSLQLISLDGVYQINLKNDSPWGKCLYVRVSLYFPINHKEIKLR